MEMLIALLLVALSEKNEALKDTLHRALDFYRENRELITLLAGGTQPPPAPKAKETDAPMQTPVCKKDSPACGGEDLKILEEFLKKQKL